MSGAALRFFTESFVDLSFSSPLDAVLKLLALGLAGAIGALVQRPIEAFVSAIRAKHFD